MTSVSPVFHTVFHTEITVSIGLRNFKDSNLEQDPLRVGWIRSALSGNLLFKFKSPEIKEYFYKMSGQMGDGSG